MGGLRLGRGSASVELSSDLSDAIERMIDGVLPAVRPAFAAAAADVAAAARADWPVKTGRSREGIEHGLRVVPGSDGSAVLEGFVRNEVAYARYVRARTTGLNAFASLIRKPMLARGEQLARELGPVVVRALNRGR